MYNPPRFKSTDINGAFQLADQNPLATLITVEDGRPQISHLPLTPKWNGEKIELIGHMARANPHWKSLTNAKVTAVFHGPHAYITPKWYAKNDVPTWNYLVAHMSGTISLIEDHDGIIKCLKDLTAHSERHWPSGWEFYIPEDLSGERLTKSIVGFKIEVDGVNFKRKLIQSKPVEDKLGVIAGLESRSDDNSRLIREQIKMDPALK